MRLWRLLIFFLLLLSVTVQAQSTLELQEFNAAYLQYGNNLHSNPGLARESARRAFGLGKQIFGDENERTAMLAINYANLLQDEAQSQDLFDEAVTIYQAVFGFGSEAMIDPLMGLARSLTDTNKYSLANVYYRRALALSEDHFGVDATKSGAIQLELGSIALTQNNVESAFPLLRSALETFSQYDDAGSVSNRARAGLLLGDYYLRTEKYEEALSILLLALETLSTYPHADVTLRNRIALIEVYEKLGRSEEATAHCLAIGAVRRIGNEGSLRPLYTVIPDSEQIIGTPTEQYGVRVGYTIDANGYVVNPILMSTIDSEVLSQVFLSAIQQFRFAPRFENGDPVASLNQQYVFRY